jgi:hypothetical protein
MEVTIILIYNHKNILDIVEGYYSNKISQYGTTPKGVDWNSLESQESRFKQLLKICNKKSSFSINDYGCGYAALYQYLCDNSFDCDYYGFDVSSAMVNDAKQLFNNRRNFVVSIGSSAERVSDYSVASGIFNVKLNIDNSTWGKYIISVLDDMNRMSTKGFSFNCLTSYSDLEYMKEELYYGDPCYFFDHCKRHYSRNVALLHDYGLFEFTILVRKE